MNEQLPISIYVCDDLKQEFAKITSVCNRLEAQFNFQTMSANWYSDEDEILFVQLYLDTPQEFSSQLKAQHTDNVDIHSDDAYSYDQKSEKEKALICHVAITDSESALLNQKNKLLAGLLQVKLQKVLNIIAHQLKLNTI